MYCLAKTCYVCLEEKSKSIININSSLPGNTDLMRIIGYLPFNFAWLKTKRIILVCEECCLHFRQTYKFLVMCLKNSKLLQRYMDNTKTSTVSNAENQEELAVTSDITMKNEVNEIKVEDEEVHMDECGPIIEESEAVFVNVDDSFVKEEDTWKREEVDDTEASLMDNNFTETSDKEMDSEMSVNCMTEEMYKTDFRPKLEETEHVYPNFEQCFVKEEDTGIREEADDKEESSNSSTGPENESNSEGFENSLNTHTQVRAGWTPFKCSICGKCFGGKSYLACHMRVHTGEKPFECSECAKCFKTKQQLNKHVWIHTDEKPFKCSECEKCFKTKLELNKHVKVHTREIRCSTCEKSFSQKSCLLRHMRMHTGEKPFECLECDKWFHLRSDLTNHMWVHTGERPFECSTCRKCFGTKIYLTRHMRYVHKVVL